MRLFRHFYSYLNEKFNFSYMGFQLFSEKRRIKSYLSGASELVGSKPLFFSILTPTYGIPLIYVKEFFESLLAQSYPHWELCLCLDGPQPGVKKYLETQTLKHPGKIKLVSLEKNCGIDAATFAAGRLVTGDYICLVDSDDTLHSSCLAVLSRAIRKNPEADFIYTDNDYMTPWGHRLHPVAKPGWNRELLKISNYINHLTVVSKPIYEKCEFIFEIDNKGVQDWIFNIYATDQAKCIVHIPFMLYHWRAREGSLATGPQGKPHVVGSTLAFMQNKAKNDFVGDVRFDLSCWNYKATSPQSCETIFLNTDDCETVAEGAKKIKNFISAKKADYYRFQVAGLEETVGDFSHLEAYLLSKNAGLVWPHRNNYTPTQYNFSKADNTYSASTRWHSFNYETLTVEAGPLHSACVRQDVLHKICDLLISEPRWSGAICGPQLTGLGMALSLATKQLGLDNISVKGAYCAEPLEPGQLFL